MEFISSNIFPGRRIQDESISLNNKIPQFPKQSSLSKIVTINHLYDSKTFKKQGSKGRYAVTFNITQAMDSDFKELKILCKQICHLFNPYQLEINLNDHHQVSVRFLAIILASLKKMRGLSILKLNLSGFLRRFGANALNKIRIKLPNLSTLHLNLYSGLDYRDPDSLSLFASSLIQQTNLTDLDLNLAYKNLSNQNLLDLMSKIELLGKKLQSLRLDLNLMKNLDSRGIEGLSNSLVKLEALQKLNLNLVACEKVKDDDIEKLYGRLNMLRNLSSLTLNLGGCNITQKTSQLFLLDQEDENDSLETEGPLIKKKREEKSLNKTDFRFSGQLKPQLSTLSLTLPFDKKTISRADFTGSFRNYLNLSALDLTIMSDKKTDKNLIKDLCLSLAHLKRLTKLKLTLYRYPQRGASDLIIQSLGHALQQLPLLDLELLIGGIWNSDMQSIAGSSWAKLFRDLGYLKNLKSLSLRMSGYKGINKDHWKEFAFSLSEMTDLTSLKLNFATICPQATKRFLEVFTAIAFRNLRNLHIFEAHFNQNVGRNFKDFSDSLSKAPSLTKIILSVHDLIFPGGPNPSPIVSLCGVKSLRYLEIQGRTCKGSQLVSLSKDFVQLSQVTSIKLGFSYGHEITPQSKKEFAQNISKLNSLKEFTFRVRVDDPTVQGGNLDLIVWNLKDLKAGFECTAADIANYQKAARRRYVGDSLKLIGVILLITFVVGLFLGYSILIIYITSKKKK